MCMLIVVVFAPKVHPVINTINWSSHYLLIKLVLFRTMHKPKANC